MLATKFHDFFIISRKKSVCTTSECQSDKHCHPSEKCDDGKCVLTPCNDEPPSNFIFVFQPHLFV